MDSTKKKDSKTRPAPPTKFATGARGEFTQNPPKWPEDQVSGRGNHQQATTAMGPGKWGTRIPRRTTRTTPHRPRRQHRTAQPANTAFPSTNRKSNSTVAGEDKVKQTICTAPFLNHNALQASWTQKETRPLGPEKPSSEKRQSTHGGLFNMAMVSLGNALAPWFFCQTRTKEKTNH